MAIEKIKQSKQLLHRQLKMNTRIGSPLFGALFLLCAMAPILTYGEETPPPQDHRVALEEDAQLTHDKVSSKNPLSETAPSLVDPKEKGRCHGVFLKGQHVSREETGKGSKSRLAQRDFDPRDWQKMTREQCTQKQADAAGKIVQNIYPKIADDYNALVEHSTKAGQPPPDYEEYALERLKDSQLVPPPFKFAPNDLTAIRAPLNPKHGV